jgi:hypothetical protein
MLLQETLVIPALREDPVVLCPRDKESYAAQTRGAGSPRKAGMTTFLNGLTP